MMHRHARRQRKRRRRAAKLHAELAGEEHAEREQSQTCRRCGAPHGRHVLTCPVGGRAYDEDLHPHS